MPFLLHDFRHLFAGGHVVAKPKEYWHLGVEPHGFHVAFRMAVLTYEFQIGCSHFDSGQRMHT